jgi:aryl-alcohol dehydrogenase-like predicted oxidoreductase
MGAWQFADAMWTARTNGFERFVSVQNEYNMLVRDIERDLLPAAAHFGAGLLPYFPLAGGLLTGKYSRDGAMPEGARLATMTGLANRYMTPANWDRIEKLEPFCKACDRPLLDLAFAWILSRPITASVIAGATKPEQVEANVRAAEWKPSAEEVAAVDAILAGESVG